MAATDSSGGQPGAGQWTVLTNRSDRVRAAGRRKSAVRPEKRADEPPIGLDHDKENERERVSYPGWGRHRARRGWNTRPSAASRSAASPRPDIAAAAGSTRITTRACGGSASSRAAIRCRRRRRTRLRATASPTALLTTNPTRAPAGGVSSDGSSITSTCTTRDGRAPRRPWRTTAVNSGRRRSLDAAGSTTDLRVPGVRRTAPDGPSDDGRPGWRAQHGCACAAEIHASSRGDDCSAGRCACSLGGSKTGKTGERGKCSNTQQFSGGAADLAAQVTRTSNGTVRELDGSNRSAYRPETSAVHHSLWRTP
jgi:hypothetical protein